MRSPGHRQMKNQEYEVRMKIKKENQTKQKKAEQKKKNMYGKINRKSKVIQYPSHPAGACST